MAGMLASGVEMPWRNAASVLGTPGSQSRCAIRQETSALPPGRPERIARLVPTAAHGGAFVVDPVDSASHMGFGLRMSDIDPVECVQPRAAQADGDDVAADGPQC